MLRLSLALLSSFVLFGCSGGSDNVGATTASEAAMLVVDGDAGSAIELTAQLQVLALERVDGSITRNLVAEGATITVSDPGGRVASVPLRGLEPGVYVALQVSLVEGSVAASQNGQPLAVTPSSLLHRIEFDRPLSTLAGDSRRVHALHGSGAEGQRGRDGGDRRRGGAVMTLGHARGLEIDNGVWTPRWRLRFGDEGLLRVEVEIASIDLPSSMARARVERFGEQLVTLDFSRRPALLPRLSVGQRLRILARMSETRTLVVLGIDEGERERGVRDFVRGRISALSPAGDGLTIDSAGMLIELAVDNDTVFLRRDVNGELAITFGDLVVGNGVVVFARRAMGPTGTAVAEVVFVVG